MQESNTNRIRDAVVIAVEDHRLLHDLACSVQDAHFRALVCSDARELESTVRTTRPLAIILDPDMQEGLGLAAARRVYTSPDTANTTVLFLVPRGSAPPEFAASFDARFTGYIMLPL